jgi:hypothetical protein
MLSRVDPVRLLLLAVFATLAITSLLGESPTWDEPYHLAQGFRFLKTGDPSFLVEDHPPGIQAIAAIPFVLAGRPLEPLPREDPADRWKRFADLRAFLEDDDAATIRLFPWAKIMIVSLGVLLGWLVYDEARRLHGVAGARLTLGMFAFDPNILAHSRLVTTDLGATLGVWLVIVAAMRWSREATMRRAALLGCAIGFALLAKFSTVSVVALLPILIAILTIGAANRIGAAGYARSAAATAVTAFLVVWAVHGFTFGPIRTWSEGKKPPPAEAPPESYEFARFLDDWKVPFPDYVFGLRWTMRHVYERGHWTYMRGENSMTGWRSYFPIAFSIKTPIPTMVLLLLALATLVRARPGREELALAVFAALYFAAAVRGSLNLGVRHLLPILPPLFVLAGRLLSPRVTAAFAPAAPRLFRAAVLAFAAWLVVGTARAHPHYLAYFNSIAGGSAGGWKWLVGPDLDWGQDLPGLARWLRAHDVDHVELSYYGFVNPSVYGIPWTPIQLPVKQGAPVTVQDIPPGTYAVSASNLVEVMSLGKGPLTVFQELDPIASIGHSIFVYRVP